MQYRCGIKSFKERRLLVSTSANSLIGLARFDRVPMSLVIVELGSCITAQCDIGKGMS